MITWSAMPSSRAGPDTAGPSTTITVGTTPEQAVSARAAWPQPCSAARPSPMSAPVEESSTSTGSRSSRAARAASAMVSLSRGDNAPASSVVPTRTFTTDRGPWRVSIVSMAAWTIPGTLARSWTVRPPPGTRAPVGNVVGGIRDIGVGATSGRAGGLRGQREVDPWLVGGPVGDDLAQDLAQRASRGRQ
jgi:hypothetical protein